VPLHRRPMTSSNVRRRLTHAAVEARQPEHSALQRRKRSRVAPLEDDLELDAPRRLKER
jgi:hypothetical protein